MSGFPRIEEHAANESLWLQQCRPLVGARRPDQASREVDVLIVGGGFTGLWTAYTLARQAPDLRIAVHEARHIGFGASGRNGGWAVGMLSGQHEVLSAIPDPAQRRAVASEIAQMVDFIGKITTEEGIDCGFAKGGMLRISALGAKQDRKFDGVLREHLENAAGTSDPTLLGPDEASARIRMAGASRGFHWPHCAAINPAQLAVGLAEACIRRGVEIVEASPVHSVGPNWVQAAAGGIRAAHVVAATDGYSDGVRGLAGRIIPVYSLMLATRPLSDGEWTGIGLAEREVFSDCSPISTYGQRTADGRLALGAFGLYPLRSRAGAAASHFAGDFALLERYLKKLLPSLKGVEVTHRWTGTLGISRTMHPAAGAEARSGLIMAGGYAARGVVGSAVFGRATAANILGSSLPTNLPPVLPMEQAFPRWEGPLLRYLGTAVSLNPERWAEHVEQSNVARPIKAAASWLAAHVPVVVQ
jgi:glycine/D-amino acid oxidase-like deaminating enzyme